MENETDAGSEEETMALQATSGLIALARKDILHRGDFSGLCSVNDCYLHLPSPQLMHFHPAVITSGTKD